MHLVYIIFSEKTQKFYVGETANLDQRLQYHNDPLLNTNSTKSGIPWNLFLTIEVKDRVTARKMEGYIKSMKSKKYILGLKENSLWIDNLLNKLQ